MYKLIWAVHPIAYGQISLRHGRNPGGPARAWGGGRAPNPTHGKTEVAPTPRPRGGDPAPAAAIAPTRRRRRHCGTFPSIAQASRAAPCAGGRGRPGAGGGGDRRGGHPGADPRGAASRVSSSVGAGCAMAGRMWMMPAALLLLAHGGRPALGAKVRGARGGVGPRGRRRRVDSPEPAALRPLPACNRCSSSEEPLVAARMDLCRTFMSVRLVGVRVKSHKFHGKQGQGSCLG